MCSIIAVSSILHNTTGHSQVDNILRGLIGLCELAFPQRVRAYYLVGSYADGSAVEGSDIDVRIIFRDDFREGEVERYLQWRQACRLVSPLSLDFPPLTEARLQRDLDWVHETVSIKAAGVFLYGDDMRDELHLPDTIAFARNVTMAPLIYFPRVHHVDPLIFPLQYPDPADPFYGYCSSDPAQEGRGSTKLLVHIIGFAATCLIALNAGQIVATKRDWLPIYQNTIGDTWTLYLTQLYQRCKQAWGYQIPQHPREQDELRALCFNALAFENHYLAYYRIFLLAELQQRDREHRLRALRRMQRIVYPDQDMLEAIRSVTAEDAELSEARAATLHIYERNNPCLLSQSDA